MATRAFSRFFFVTSLLAMGIASLAQTEPDTVAAIDIWESKPYEASPTVNGNRKPKGVELNYIYLSGFDIESEAQMPGIEDAKGRIKNMHGYDFKVKAPLVLKPRTKFILGLAYAFYEYEFEDPDEIESALYRNIDEKALRNAELAFYASHSISRDRFLAGKLGINANGDFTKGGLPFTRFIKSNMSMVYGKKLNEYTSFGFGAYFSYTFGHPQIYPAILWNHTFNERWGIEALLPAEAQFRRTFSPKSILLIGFSANDASYHIVVKNPQLEKFNTLELRNSDVRFGLTFEQEIYEVLWFSVSAGYHYAFNFNLTRDNRFNTADIIVNTIAPSPYLGFSIFLVPPKSFFTEVVQDAPSQ